MFFNYLFLLLFQLLPKYVERFENNFSGEKQIFKNYKVEIPNSGIPKQFGTQTYTPHVIFFHIQYPELTEDQINYIKKIKEIINEDSGNSEKSGEHGSSEIKNIIDNSTEYTKDKKE